MEHKKYKLQAWMEADMETIIDKFYDLPGAEYHGAHDQAFCYIPGTRKDRVLLVAHADTVWDRCPPRKVGYAGGFYYSEIDKLGIGADDRVGCAILWDLKDLGHSLLILTGEESGCLGSSWLMENRYFEEEINKHQFAIQFAIQ